MKLPKNNTVHIHEIFEQRTDYTLTVHRGQNCINQQVLFSSHPAGAAHFVSSLTYSHCPSLHKVVLQNV